MHPVITIGRQFGSGGRELGKMLAERLAIDYYDKELLVKAAAQMGIAPTLFELNDERIPNLRTGGAVGFSMGYGQMPWYNGPLMAAGSVSAAIADLIRQIATERPCVIVGRTADHILRQAGIPVLSIFVSAPMSERVKRIMERSKDLKREKDAQALAEKTDRLRASYYNFHTDRRWGEAATYDLTFDTSLLPLNDIVDVVVLYLSRRFPNLPQP